MDDGRRPDSQHEHVAELVVYQRPFRCCEADQTPSPDISGYSYLTKLGRETIQLDPVEFRILRFLAARPYRPCTRSCIAEAVSTHRYPVTPEALDRHVARLRDALGFFRDYIQTVPYVGYRFRE